MTIDSDGVAGDILLMVMTMTVTVIHEVIVKIMGV